jgi:hypothetical protein
VAKKMSGWPAFGIQSVWLSGKSTGWAGNRGPPLDTKVHQAAKKLPLVDYRR